MLIITSCTDDTIINKTDPADVHAQYFDGDYTTVTDILMFAVELKKGITDLPKDLIVPKHLGGNTVEALLDGAFREYEIDSVYVPDCLKHITYSVVLGSGIKKITVPARFDIYGFGAEVYKY